MSESSDSIPAGGGEMASALFASLVMQQSGIAFMLLGRTPNPQSGKVERDLRGAKMFIDMLEMLESKTRGNLDRHEQVMLKQTLMELHLAYVEAVQQPDTAASAPEAVAAPASAPAAPPPGETTEASQPEAVPAAATPAPDDDSKKKFSKKY